jgi:NAD(P)-dependent dehydrogenase (short-subunit alcohol dehydrogenase family)
MGKLDGKVTVVTGAASGIDRAAGWRHTRRRRN